MATWFRLTIGVLFVLVGMIWIGQGFDVMKGSGMSGHRQYAVAGAVVVLAGLLLLWGTVQARARPRRQ